MLRVGDLERSIAFYRDVLGMELFSRKDYPEGKFTLAFLGYARNPEQAEIELHGFQLARVVRQRLPPGGGIAANALAESFARLG